MTTVPPAPWSLRGESLVALLRRPGAGAPLPAGVAPVPGPAVLVATCFSASPVGPYLELLVAVPARLGPWFGWCATTMVVDGAAARDGGRANWGFPKQIGSLVWQVDGDERRLRWVERGIEVRGRVVGLALPGLVPLRVLQRRGDGPVGVGAHAVGRGRPTRVHVEVPDGDALARLRGAHAGLHVAGLHLHVRPARRPAGVAALTAPLRAPEPALSLPAARQGRLAQR